MEWEVPGRVQKKQFDISKRMLHVIQSIKTRPLVSHCNLGLASYGRTEDPRKGTAYKMSILLHISLDVSPHTGGTERS